MRGGREGGMNGRGEGQAKVVVKCCNSLCETSHQHNVCTTSV